MDMLSIDDDRVSVPPVSDVVAVDDASSGTVADVVSRLLTPGGTVVNGEDNDETPVAVASPV
jgi:hypothetical protein